MPLTDSPHEGRHVEVGDTRLFVVERGLEGYPLICLHGGPSLDHWLFADYLDALAPEVRVILFDQRGRGMSDPVPVETRTMPQLADDVVALARALELDEYAVLGHSFGGFIALRLAVDRPDEPAGVVLVATVPDGTTVAPLEQRLASLDERTRANAVRSLDEVPDDERFGVVADYLRAGFADPTGESTDEYFRRIAPLVVENETGELGEPGYGHALTDRLGEIRARTLVVGGRRDPFCPFEYSELMAERIPNAELVALDCGHFPFAEQQDAFVEAVHEFVLRASA